MGTRYLVPHAFFYSTHALRKHDAPPSFFFQMPFWPLFGELSRRVDTIGKHFEGTYIEARVLVVDPTSGQPGDEDRAVYGRLMQVLTEEHIDFLMVDTDILQAGEIQDGAVRIRDITADLVILPPMPLAEAELVQWLSEFEDAGGRVIRCSGERAASDLRELIRGDAPPGIPIRAESGAGRKVQMVTRRGEDRLLWFLLNTGGESVQLRFDTRMPLREIPLSDHQPHLLEWTGDGYRRQLDSFEAVLLASDGKTAVVARPGGGEVGGGGAAGMTGAEFPDQPTAAGGAPARSGPAPADAGGQEAGSVAPPLFSTREGEISVKRYGAVQRVTMGTECRTRPLDPNLLRLADWSLCTVDEEGEEGPRAEVGPMPVANQLDKTALPFTPEVRTGFGTMPRFDMPSLHLRYRTAWRSDFSGEVRLVIEPGSLRGDWEISINGHSLDPDDLEDVDAFVPGCRAGNVESYLAEGMNEMVVDVRTDRLDGGLVNPLYLSGDFGVLLDPLTLVELDAQAGFERYEANGLTFYAGVIEYQRTFELAKMPEDDTIFVLHTDRPFEQACAVSFNDGPFHPLPWSPRRWVVGADELREGENDLKVRVYTTLSRAFEGERFDIPTHKYVPVGDRL
jgi:hypothetical protein